MADEWDKQVNMAPNGKLQLESILLHSADAIWVVDLEERVRQINPAFESLFGWTKEDVIGNSLPIVPENLAGEIEQLHQKIKAGHYASGYETQRLCKDGRLIYVSATLSPVRDANGEVIGISGTCRDITATKHAEEELRKTKEMLESFVLNSMDAIWMIDLDERVQQINPAFEMLFGWTAEDVVGNRLPIIPDFLLCEIEQVHQEVKAGHSKSGYETQRLCKDGRLIYVSATLSPVRNKQGEVIGVSGTCRDITHTKRAEEELRKAKDLLEAFVENSADAIWMIDLEDRVQQVNPAFETLFGWSEEEVVGNMLPIVPDFLAAQIHELHQEIKLGNRKSGYETQRRCKDGRLIHVSATLSPVRNSQGKVIGVSGTCRDITKNKQSEEMLIQTEKLSIAGELAAGMAHEIRNPLTALKGFVQLMSYDHDSQSKYLDVMASELSRIELIVSELLVLAKPQANVFKRKEISPIIQDVLTLSEAQAILHNIQIQALLEDDLPALDCDENQMKQVLINFIRNAIEAMPGGGTIRVEATLADPSHMRIRVQDEGKGIPQEQLARLGEPFYTTKTKGTGLGLMVSKKIIEGHQGTLEIASEVGVGTTVDLYLPLPDGD
ncbi:PAS domain S-box protein [Tumebacillus sp. ITR2]|uniref:histidine kinase n=1 Tax=Tumebacillus amylolyticus TaxID=2801339 RepID=A0ABS1J4J0_9BACL|nr:PAS domain-containing sensor histidine kinase [Tumebacillus amylolyticus]MBL0385147.1 PAS domain S-box protein [Tumebacillus amylolyticus]